MSEDWDLQELRRMNWRLAEIWDDDGLNHFVVVPLCDIKDHDEDTGPFCWCNPRVEYEGDVPMVIHNAMDGRK